MADVDSIDGIDDLCAPIDGGDGIGGFGRAVNKNTALIIVYHILTSR